VTFTRDNGSNVLAYYLYVGTSLGGGDLFSGAMGSTTQLVNSIPTNGSTIYASLYSYIGSGWQGNNYTYTAAGAGTKAQITSPTNNSVLPGASVNFTRDNGSGVAAYYLYVGTTPGGGNLFSGVMSSTTQNVAGIPTNGSTIYASLYSYIGSAWQGNSYSYTAFGATPAAITSPTPGTTLPGSSTTFQRNAGVGVLAYYLYVGTTPGGTNLFAGAMSSTSQLVTGIPTNVGPIYVALYSYIGTGWQGNSYTYTSPTSPASDGSKQGVQAPANVPAPGPVFIPGIGMVDPPTPGVAAGPGHASAAVPAPAPAANPSAGPNDAPLGSKILPPRG
jgi:hypothetical protein